jgi:5-methylcytosine-specific restriction endonuclease McrA
MILDRDLKENHHVIPKRAAIDCNGFKEGIALFQGRMECKRTPSLYSRWRPPKCNYRELIWNVDNLVPACAECNHIKLYYDPSEGGARRLS